MKPSGRRLVGILLTPLVITALSFVLTPILSRVGIFWSPSDLSLAGRPSPIRFTPYLETLRLTYLVCAVLGLPTLWFLCRKRWVRWSTFAVAGLIVSFCFAFLWMAPWAFSESEAPLTQIVLLLAKEPHGMQLFLVPMAVYGALTGSVYWLIARPDRSESH